MSLSRTFTHASVIALAAIALSAPQALAQDVKAMAKWTSLTIVRYRAVGEFSGTTPVLVSANGGLVRSAPVTDRIELEFDWNQQEMRLVGKPVIRNFPTKMGAVIPVTGCPAARVEGTVELATALALNDGPMHASGFIELTIRRDQPGGSIPWVLEEGHACGSVWESAAAKSETSPDVFSVPLAMMLAMPGTTPTTPDGKSFVVKRPDGWTYTYTPTPVK
jgi:hypothetical protein